ncbi:MAG: bifunctional DNA-formamidopyrimidine glycosylase/DNA-(apurinic or apyrimidinic site) lyase, partial [Candidatus Acidiferrales bacterium]
MPELPEVETVARGLREVLPGRRVLSVRLGKTDFIDDPAALERDLPGNTFAGIRRLGKFLLLDLAPKESPAQETSLLIHLGMTGKISVCPPETPVAPHTHVFLALDDGRELRYNDVRRFGRMAFLANGDHARILGALGLEPLEVSLQEFRSRIRARKSRIKALLLNQNVLRGIGNIYADESLWRAKIHPEKIAARLQDAELTRLHRAVQHILREAIRLRGSSVSDYVDLDGGRGEFQQQHRAYQHDGKKCFRCGAIIRRIIVAGRSTHFCPQCQPAPRKARKPGAPRSSRKLRRRKPARAARRASPRQR